MVCPSGIPPENLMHTSNVPPSVTEYDDAEKFSVTPIGTEGIDIYVSVLYVHATLYIYAHLCMYIL